MAFPSTLSTFTDPNPTQKLNSPSQSSVVTALNTAVAQIEKVIGQEGGASASALGTIIGDLRNASSGGGGHVQAANKGGTGQTSYSKGDILVALSSSVVSKLAVGTNGDVLVADANQSAGIKWSGTVTPKVYTNATASTLTNTAVETSIMVATIPGSTLGTSNALRARTFVSNFNVDSAAETIQIKGYYGTSVFATATFGSITGTQTASLTGIIQLDVISNGATNAQLGFLSVRLVKGNVVTSTALPENVANLAGRLTVDSEAPQLLAITAKMNAVSVSNKLAIEGSTVERII